MGDLLQILNPSLIGLHIALFQLATFRPHQPSSNIIRSHLRINQLSVSDRLDLIEQIWDSLPEQVSPDEVPDWHLPELARRRADAEAHPGLGKTWREVLDRIEGGT